MIIGSSSLGMSKRGIIDVAGPDVERAYRDECKKTSNPVLIVTPPGRLPCKQIYFLKSDLTSDVKRLASSFNDLISIIATHMEGSHFISIAFPAIGYREDNEQNSDHLVEVVIKQMIRHFVERNSSWKVKFVIPFHQTDVYETFYRQLSTVRDGTASRPFHIPSIDSLFSPNRSVRT